MRNFRIGRVDIIVFFFFFFFKKNLQISSIVKVLFVYIAREYIWYFFPNEHDMGR